MGSVIDAIEARTREGGASEQSDQDLGAVGRDRFTVVPKPSPEAGTSRTAIISITPTVRAGSAVSAAGGFFIPVPLLKVRPAATTGGLAVETELLAHDGARAAETTPRVYRNSTLGQTARPNATSANLMRSQSGRLSSWPRMNNSLEATPSS